MRPLQTRKLLAEDVADRIREEILSGGFTQGERLVEAGIAQQLGVSRGPVREAFKLLRAKAWSGRPHRGTFVVRLTSADVRESRCARGAQGARRAQLAGARASDLRAVRRLLTDFCRPPRTATWRSSPRPTWHSRCVPSHRQPPPAKYSCGVPCSRT
jgi:DNA-binding GntR family transcriptional regulator